MNSQFWSRLLRAEDGFVVSSELVLIATVVGIGMLVGLTTVRDQVVQEFGDAAVAVGTVNQSYSFASVSTDNGTAAGSENEDLSDFCEVGGIDVPGRAPACIHFQFKAGAFPSSGSGEG